MREYRAGGWSLMDLVRLYDMSESSVCGVVTGRTYKTAGGPIQTARSYVRSVLRA